MKTKFTKKIVPILMGRSAAAYAWKVLDYEPIAYWPLWETSGGVAEDISGNDFDGAYTGVTLGQPGIGDGKTCPLFGGTEDFTSIFSVGLRAAFNGAEGTFALWVKVFNVGVWTDETARYIWRLRADGQNYISAYKDAADNRIRVAFEAGDVQEERIKDGVTDVSWIHYALTWSKTAEEVRVFYDGTQEGATMETLGVWVGILNNAFTMVGSSSGVPGNPWHGWLAHAAVWDSALNPTQIAKLAVV